MGEHSIIGSCPHFPGSFAETLSVEQAGCTHTSVSPHNSEAVCEPSSCIAHSSSFDDSVKDPALPALQGGEDYLGIVIVEIGAGLGPWTLASEELGIPVLAHYYTEVHADAEYVLTTHSPSAVPVKYAEASRRRRLVK